MIGSKSVDASELKKAEELREFKQRFTGSAEGAYQFLQKLCEDNDAKKGVYEAFFVGTLLDGVDKTSSDILQIDKIKDGMLKLLIEELPDTEFSIAQFVTEVGRTSIFICQKIDEFSWIIERGFSWTHKNEEEE